MIARLANVRGITDVRPNAGATNFIRNLLTAATGLFSLKHYTSLRLQPLARRRLLHSPSPGNRLRQQQSAVLIFHASATLVSRSEPAAQTPMC